MDRIKVELEDTTLEGQFRSIHPDYQGPSDPDPANPDELFEVRFSIMDDELGPVWINGWNAYDIVACC